MEVIYRIFYYFMRNVEYAYKSAAQENYYSHIPDP